jgi:RNA polymerase sigma factor
MQPEALDIRAQEAKNDDYKLNELIKDYQPYIIKCIKDIKGGFVDTANDEELSLGLISFEKAIKTYAPGKGNFLSYARVLIRRRIIDYYRKNARDKNVIYLENHNLSKVDGYCENNIINERAEEIERLKDALQIYKINFDDLITASPKHKKVKDICKEIIKLVSKNDVLLDNLKKTKKLPVYEIERLLDIKRRKFERARKYIIAGIVVMTGDYDYIKEYI